MPQSKPMMWTTLMISINIIMFMMVMKMLFSLNNNNKKINNYKIKLKSIMLKW